MALYKTGSGVRNSDWKLPSPTVAPDQTNYFIISANGTQTITTTQKAKQIVIMSMNYTSTASAVAGGFSSYNVEKDEWTNIMGRYSSGDWWYDTGTPTNTSTWITSVTDTAIKFKNTSTQVSRLYLVMIWY